MSDALPYGSNDPIPPGTRATLHGIDVVAVDNRGDAAVLGCRQCPFSKYDGNGKCDATPCVGVYWLTVPDYVTYRLTS